MCRRSGGPPTTSPSWYTQNDRSRLAVIDGVLLAQAAGGGVARVDEQALARRLGLLVHPLEAGDRQVHLAADLEHVGHRRALRRPQLVGDDADRGHVGRDVLADPPVATRRRLHVAAALVADAHRQRRRSSARTRSVTASSGRPRATRWPHAASSSALIALSRLIIGTECTTGANSALGAPPTACAGEPSTTSSGCSASSWRSSRTSRSKSPSEISGSSSSW